MVRRVAIIGAGCSGLTSIKTCLEEGLEPVCFEKSDDIGGLWNYAPPDADGVPTRLSVYRSCTINTSKEMSAFSDFPMPAEFPVFLPHRYLLKYFRLYADHFRLREYIRFRHEVVSVKPAENYDITGQWTIEYSRCKDGDSERGHRVVDTFDAVLICSGHHVYKHQPYLPGSERFKGKILHSSEYRTPEQFDGKRVVVVGVGNSAADIAVDLSKICDKVFLSTRSGAWVIARMGPLGYPADALANSRLMFTMPLTVMQKFVELMSNFRFHQGNYGLQSEHRCLEVHPTISDDLPLRIMNGEVVVKDDVDRIDEDGVHFKDGGYERLDGIVMATGYDYRFPFLDQSVLQITDNKVDLYKHVFPPKMKHPTLGFIGLVQAIGSVIPISEMQARWSTRVFNGLCKVPSEPEMVDDIEQRWMKMQQQYITSRRHTLQTFWIEYMDELAAEVKVRPRLPQMLLRDPALSMRCFLGPCVPAQYRLRGPGADPKAATTIRRALSNNVSATKTRVLRDEHNCNHSKCLHPQHDQENQQQSQLERIFMNILMLILLWQIISIIYYM